MSNLTVVYDTRNLLHIGGGTLSGVLSLLMSDMRRFKPRNVIWLYEGKPDYKIGLYPEYKATRSRKERTFDPSALQEELKAILQTLDCSIVSADGEEADDMAAAVVQDSTKASPMVLITSDKDIFQLVDPDKGISCFDRPRQLWLRTHEQVSNRVGVPAHQIALYKTLYGDTGDNVPVLYHKRHLSAAKYGSPVTFPESSNTEEGRDQLFAVLESRGQIAPTDDQAELGKPTLRSLLLNWDLVKLDADRVRPLLKVDRYKDNRDALKSVLIEKGIGSLQASKVCGLIPATPTLFGM